MPLLFFDGFDMYQSNDAPMGRGWTLPAGNVNVNQAGRFGTSKSLYINSAANSLVASLTASATVCVGVAHQPSAMVYAATGSDLIRFANSVTVQCKLGVKADGALVIGRGDFTTNLIATSAAAIITNSTWNYIEVELTRHASTGIFKVWVNGALVINSTGVNTGASNIDRVSICGHPAGNNFFDDFYLTNDATRLGERRVDYLPPSADSSPLNWTRSTGATNFSTVDEIPTNNDTDYISSATVGHKDLYDLTNLSTTPLTIDAVQTVLVGRKDDATTREVRTNLKTGSTTTNGATRAMAATYVTTSDLYLLNPDTAAAWVASDINAAQLGVEVVT